MDATKAMKMAEALADLSGEDAAQVNFMADALRRRSEAVKTKAPRAKKAAAAAPVTGKKRGRPKGSKNSKPEVEQNVDTAPEETQH